MSWLPWRKSKPADRWDLSMPILRWSKDDAWTLRDAVEGTLIVGATGSGKSSAAGRTILDSFLAAGFGGLALTVKPTDRFQFESLCRKAGRIDDLLLFGPAHSLHYNFLEDEITRSGQGAGLTQNVLFLLTAILEVTSRNSGRSDGREDSGYWAQACAQLMTNLIDLLSLATGRLSVPDLYRLVLSAPASSAQVGSENWKSTSYCFFCLQEADKRAKTPSQSTDFELVADYFLVEFPNLSERTRSVIVSTFSAMVDTLNRSTLRTLFCTDTNVKPEVVDSGKIILVDMPVSEFGKVGQVAQVILKYCLQHSLERRDITKSLRPTFIYVDEAQHFVTSFDQAFQATCRSSRVATVLLTQHLAGFHAALGGNEKAKAETTALFSSLNTKLFLCNSDAETNQFASTLIGRTLQTFVNSSNSHGPDEWLPAAFGIGHAGHTSAGFSESYEFEIQPNVFSTLRTGGSGNRGVVDAIVFQNGKRFNGSGRTWLPVTFQQAR